MTRLFSILPLAGLMLIPSLLGSEAFSSQEEAKGAAPRASASAVVVELFTSEGCSSCPPADALLARLAGQSHSGNAQVVALEEHVDYWDDQGWRDGPPEKPCVQRKGPRRGAAPRAGASADPTADESARLYEAVPSGAMDRCVPS